MPDTTPRAALGWPFWTALLVVGALRLWHLPAAGLPDYDSARNWQLVQEMARGDWRHLFYHANPGFFLLYALVARFTAEAWVFQALNALVAVAAVGLFARLVVRAGALGGERPWKRWETALLVLLAGSGTLLTFSGRDFTANSLGLLAGAGLLAAYFDRLRETGQGSGLLRTAAWLAAGLSVNYKFLLAVPVLAAMELWRADWAAWRGRVAGKLLVVLAAPYAVLGAVGVWAGLPWHRWPAVYYRLVVPAGANPAGRHATLHPDFGYYFRYLLEFESPALLLGLAAAAALGLRRRLWPAGAAPTLLAFLAAWAACWLLGMSLLVKAPRGLLLAYLPLAGVAVLAVRALLPPVAALPLWLAALGLNGVRLWQNVYRFPPSNYPAVARWLRTHGARHVASTVGLGVAPYLAPGSELAVIANENDLPALRRRGFRYVLLDGYWRVAHVPRFEQLRRQPAFAAWPEPRLGAPLLFLEHSEFTGLGYAETLRLAREAQADTAQLRIVDLGEPEQR